MCHNRPVELNRDKREKRKSREKINRWTRKAYIERRKDINRWEKKDMYEHRDRREWTVGTLVALKKYDYLH